MRIWLPLVIAAALLPIYMSESAPASAEQLLRPGGAGAGNAAPRVLRGSAIAPRPAPAPMEPGRWQITAGDELWLVNPASGEVVACHLRNTAKVGVRIVRCFTDSLPRTVAD